MRTSTTIVEKLERWLASPGWGYCPICYFPPMARARLLARSFDQEGQRSARGPVTGDARSRPVLAGADHFSLTVTDLDRSERVLRGIRTFTTRAMTVFGCVGR